MADHSMERDAFAYVDFAHGAVLVGRLWSRVRKGRESATFEYDKSWLDRPDRFALEPALMLAQGPYHTGVDRPMFGAIGDSAPDRWGRVLMRRAERKRASRENRTPRTLFEIDFLLNVDDETRAGALRFATTQGGPFLAEASDNRIPTLVALPRLLAATERVLDDDDSGDHDDDDLHLLLAPGSSLGGARPKASVRDDDGALAIAKFPHRHDTIDTVLWEAVALTLAKDAGIEVASSRVIPVGNKTALLLRRFDREGARRIPFLSAMSMLGAADNEQHSYLEIVEAIRRYGAKAALDCAQLWRRAVFNILISNTDDHLRNHGFLYGGIEGWSLSPAYDLNPVPVDIKPRILSTAIDSEDPSASIDLAYANAGYFGLASKDARTIAAEVGQAVSRWRDVAERMGLSRAACTRMASAFEHQDQRKVRGA
jgi:serine/threonine-protein kinase HipA